MLHVTANHDRRELFLYAAGRPVGSVVPGPCGVWEWDAEALLAELMSAEVLAEIATLCARLNYRP